MTRFRAYASDSSEDEEEQVQAALHSQQQQQQHQHSNQQHPQHTERLSHSGSEAGSEGEGDLAESDEEEDEGSEGSDEEDHSDPDEEADDDEETQGAGRRRRVSRRMRLVQNEDGEYELAHGADGDEGGELDDNGPHGDRSLIPWAQQVGVDAQRMHVMQASMFRVPEEAAALRALQFNGVPVPPPPRLLPINSRQSSRKHSRDSDGENMPVDARERSSFAHDIEPQPYRQSRKYARVEALYSAANTHEGAFVDAGLALGRSYRVSWGPGGKLVHLGALCSPNASSPLTANSSTIYLTTFPSTTPLSLIPAPSNATNSTEENQVPLPLPLALLQHHLSYTTIAPDEARVPFAQPSGTDLNFASFARLFPPSSTSPVATLFRLGRALFDPLKPRLPPRNTATAVTPTIRRQVESFLRTNALSEFLSDTLAPTIDSILRSPSIATEPSSSNLNLLSSSTSASSSPIASAFTLLTGNQVARASEQAINAGYIKLATLISQAGGDEYFQSDIRAQLKIWKDEGLTAGGTNNGNSGQKAKQLISDDIKRIYALLGGHFCDEEDKEAVASVLGGLDWKRAFAVCLWYGYGGSIGKSVKDAFSLYETLLKRDTVGKIPRPAPWYAEPGSTKSGNLTSSRKADANQQQNVSDAHYALLRLHADPTLTLSQVLSPLSFSPSPIDWSLCWHLYIIFSRCMRIRDLGDRQDPVANPRLRPIVRNNDISDEGVDEERVEGHSPSADLLASMYAWQLAGAGHIQEAIFVLLHIEGSAGREKAIKDLLQHSAAKLDEWTIRGLVGSLKVPMAWVNEAKAIHAYYNGDAYNAYELYLAAGMYNLAHDLAVSELAPDAILRRDLELLALLFEPLANKAVNEWNVQGKVFLDYVHILTRLPDLCEEETSDAVPDAAVASEIDELARKIPKLIGILPDVLTKQKSDRRHKAALIEMTSALVALVDRARPLSMTELRTTATVDEKTKLGHVRSTAYARFLKSL